MYSIHGNQQMFESELSPAALEGLCDHITTVELRAWLQPGSNLIIMHSVALTLT